MKKGIAAILLCMQIIYAGSVYAIPKTVRQAGILDTLEDFTKTYTVSDVVRGDGVKASGASGSLVYKTKSSVTEFYISISGGEENTGFKVYTSADNSSYFPVASAANSGEVLYQDKQQTVYQYKNLSQNQNYVKIELLNPAVSLNSVFINVDFADPALMSLFEQVIESGGTSSSVDREITTEDVELYKNRFVQKYLASVPKVDDFIDTIDEDGSWPDINYSGENGALTQTHVERIESMAKAVSNEKSALYQDEDLMEKLVLALEYWVKNDIEFTNWYQNEITVPECLGNTLLVAGDMLPAETEEKIRSYLLDKISSLLEPFDNGTGANVVATQMNRIRYAMYANDLERIKSAFDRIAEEVTVVTKLDPEENAWRNRLWDSYVNLPHLPDTKEGIQADYSVLFHGPLLYSGSYGLGFVTEISRILVDTQQTNLFPSDGVVDFVDHILEHYRWITRGTTMDYSVLGRGISRNSTSVASQNASGILQAAKILSEIPGMYRGDELKAYYEASSNKKAGSNSALVEHSIFSVVASSEPEAENPALNTIDKSLETRWSSNNVGDIITYDLQEVKTVGAVGVAFYSGNTRQTDFAIELSEDNVTWNRVFAGQSSGTTSNLEYYIFPVQQAQYVRLVCNGNTSNEWNSVSEVSVFETIDMSKSAEEGISFQQIGEQGETKIYTASTVSVEITNAVVGNRYFWKADYTTHQQPNFLATIRTSSNRTIATEAVNTENIKGTYLADGCTFIHRDGTEYDDIFGAWDWYKIPGTTTQLKPFEPVTVQHLAVPGSSSDLVGGVSDGNFGATAMELVRDGLYAKKAWFLFEDEFVALGTDIKNNGKYDYITTMNQSLLKGDVIVGRGDTEKKLQQGIHQNQQADWVHHDQTGYVFFDTETVNLGNQPVTGDRIDINWGGVYTRPNKTDLVTRDIFSLWVDHTDADAKKEYAYAVVPGITPAQAKDYAVNKPVEIISNSSQLQAVEHPGLNVAQGVFWEAGSMDVLDDIGITVDQPVLLQATRKDNKLYLAVSSIAARADLVTITVNRILTGSGAIAADEGTTQIQVQLPSGEYAGQSVVLEFDIV